MMNTKISIIVPVYNIEVYIARCIESIIHQSLDNWELILVDDGSKDGSGNICDEYSQKDSRIRSFHITNGGASVARKYGVEQAKGEWIMFVDGDDLIPNQSLEVLSLFCTKSVDIIVGTLLNNNRTVFNNQICGEIDNYTYIQALLLNQVTVGPVAKLYRMELFKKASWDVGYRIIQNEDLLMLISLAVHANKILIVNNVICYDYIYNPLGASKSKVMPVEDWLKLFKFIEAQLKTLEHKEKVLKEMLCYKLHRIYDCMIRKNLSIDTYQEFQDLSPL